jgi:calcineurin-like phosphoesterase family protein
VENEGGPEETAPTRAELQSTVDLLDEGAMLPLADYRVLLTSDTHYTYRQTWYDVKPEARMQTWVDAILSEHALRPFDLIVILGDTSLDHWKYNGGGSYLKDGVSTTKTFMENYVSQLPAEVPVFVLAGNHEQFGNEKWREIVGNDRQGSFVLGDHLFLFLDSYNAELDPSYHHDGYATAPDVAFIREEMEKYPQHKVYLLSHGFDLNLGGDEFAEIVCNPRVVTLFQGHTHQCTPKDMGAEYQNKKLLQTGNFSYTAHSETAQSMIESFWGFRDLVLVGDRAVSRYIVADSAARIMDEITRIPRQLRQIVLFETK